MVLSFKGDRFDTKPGLLEHRDSLGVPGLANNRQHTNYRNLVVWLVVIIHVLLAILRIPGLLFRRVDSLSQT